MSSHQATATGVVIGTLSMLFIGSLLAGTSYSNTPPKPTLTLDDCLLWDGLAVINAEREVQFCITNPRRTGP